jgi:hypothetical protein
LSRNDITKDHSGKEGFPIPGGGAAPMESTLRNEETSGQENHASPYSQFYLPILIDPAEHAGL